MWSTSSTSKLKWLQRWNIFAYTMETKYVLLIWNHHKCLSRLLGTHHLISGRGGGGGVRVFVACKLFFLPLRENNLFFGDQRPTIFFLCFVEEIFCRMLSLLCTLPFRVFSGQHIFHQFRQQTFSFCPHFQQTFFWLLWRQTIYFNFFSSPPPPPRYQMLRPLPLHLNTHSLGLHPF